MKEQETSVWTALDGPWYYLGREVAGGFEIATLLAGQGSDSSRPSGSQRRVGETGENGENDGSEQRQRTAAKQANVRQLPLAPAFTTEAGATPFVDAAPAGVKLLAVAADDQRAKEEWLRAVIEQGVRTLVFDVKPETLDRALESTAALPVHTALGYILSQRRATACL